MTAHVRLDSFIDHDNILAGWEAKGELEPPAGSRAWAEKYPQKG